LVGAAAVLFPSPELPLLPPLLPELLHALHASSMANSEIFNQEDEQSARSLIA
jgi:hypothetical protein